jgi:glycosyltransferase involved in cell wall biosynthesis
VLRTANGGTAAARNSGIEQARGLFVTFLDSDDEYLPEHLSSRREMLLSHEGIELLHGGVTVIGDPWVIDRFDTTQKIHINDCVVGGTFVIRRDQLSRIGPFREGAYADDALFFERAEEAGVAIAATDYPTYRYYRNVPNQQTSVYTTPPAPHGS